MLPRPLPAWAIEVYFDRWGLDPNDCVDRTIADFLSDLSARGGFGEIVDAIRDEKEITTEIVVAWRTIIKAERE